MDAEYLLRFHGIADFLIGLDERTLRGFAPLGTTDATVRHLFFDQVMPLALTLRDGLVVHGGTVAVADQVLALIGDTGQGKSTLTASLCLAGCALLADDCLLVRECRHRFDAYPTYPGLRLWPDAAEVFGIDPEPLAKVAHYTEKVRLDAAEGCYTFCGEPRRLGRIFLLDARTERVDGAEMVSIVPLSRRDAFSALIAYTFRLDTSNSARLEREFDLVTRLVFQKGFEHLSAVREAVLADAATPVAPGCLDA